MVGTALYRPPATSLLPHTGDMSHRTLSGQFDPIQAHEEKLFRDLTSAPEPFDAT